MATRVRIDGLAELKAKLRNLRDHPEVKVAIKDAGFAGGNLMSAAAPVRSGLTRKKIRVSRAGFSVTIRETATRAGVSYPMILDRSEKYGHVGWWRDELPAVIDVVERELQQADREIERKF